MAFPQTSAPTESSFATGTSHLVSMPGTVNNGDLLRMLVSSRQQALDTITTPAGWTEKWESHSNQTRAALYLKIGDGTEGGTTVDVVTNASHPVSAQVHRITDWFGSLAAVEAGTEVAEVVNNPNPPSLTASWGALDNLWFVDTGGADDDATASAYPAGFGNGADTVSGGGINAGCEVGTAWKEDAVATLDPGTFTWSEAETFITNILVIRPAASPTAFSPALHAYAQRRSTLLRM